MELDLVTQKGRKKNKLAHRKYIHKSTLYLYGESQGGLTVYASDPLTTHMYRPEDCTSPVQTYSPAYEPDKNSRSKKDRKCNSL